MLWYAKTIQNTVKIRIKLYKITLKMTIPPYLYPHYAYLIGFIIPYGVGQITCESDLLMCPFLDLCIVAYRVNFIFHIGLISLSPSN